jgi:hypothetical protein
MQKLFLLFPKKLFSKADAEKVNNKSYDTKRMNKEFGGKGVNLYTWSEFTDAVNNQDIDVLDYWITQINYINL